MTDQMREVVFPIVLGLGVGLVTEALSQLLLRSGRVPGSTKGVWRMLAAALALTVGVAVYMLQPKLHAVPSLARLSADEAAQVVAGAIGGERSGISDAELDPWVLRRDAPQVFPEAVVGAVPHAQEEVYLPPAA